MSRVTRVLLLLAVVVPVTAYVAGSVAPTGPAVPTDHSPVILRDRVDDRLGTTTPVAPSTSGAPATPRTTRAPSPTPTGDGDRPPGTRDDGDEARVVTPQPTPVGEDDDDEWDDDGPDEDDDETDDGDDSGDDGDD